MKEDLDSQKESVLSISGFIKEFGLKPRPRNPPGRGEVIEMGYIEAAGNGVLITFDRDKNEAAVVTITQKKKAKTIIYEVPDGKIDEVVKVIYSSIRVFPKEPIDVLETAMAIHAAGNRTLWCLRVLDPFGGGIEMVIVPWDEESLKHGLVRGVRSTALLAKKFSEVQSVLISTKKDK